MGAFDQSDTGRNKEHVTFRGQPTPETPAGQTNEPQMKISRHSKPVKKLQIVLVSPKNFAFRTRSRRLSIGRSLCVLIG